ncbi:MAG: hypothetical protein ACRD92_02750 [Nitrosopumilaceae archaeon]
MVERIRKIETFLDKGGNIVESEDQADVIMVQEFNDDGWLKRCKEIKIIRDNRIQQWLE